MVGSRVEGRERIAPSGGAASRYRAAGHVLLLGLSVLDSSPCSQLLGHLEAVKDTGSPPNLSI